MRVPDLHALRCAVIALSTENISELTASTAVVVPTQSAAHQLRRRLVAGSSSPELVTRDELYQSFHRRLPRPLRQLAPCEREVLLRACARDAAAGGAAPPFDVRAGLVAEMARFYDQLRRQGQRVGRFEELLVATLTDESDRGAARLLRQTRFLAATFRAYEQQLRAIDAADEHVLRDRLLTTPPADPLRHLVVAVADWIADPGGLYTVDFDLLSRIPGLERIDVVATRALLESGFHQRIHDWLPAIEEIDADVARFPPSPKPAILVPEAPGDRNVFVCRDREEELVAVARRLKAGRSALDRVAVAFERPLPYLYLAREVFGTSRIPYQTRAGLPLAAEPAAAALDLAIEFVSSQFSRSSAVALLGSPHFELGHGPPISRQALAGLGRVMRDARYLGEIEALRALEPRCAGDGEVLVAWHSAVCAAEELLPLVTPGRASVQLNTLAAFFMSHRRSAEDDRGGRARAAIADVLHALASAYSAHHDGDVTIDDLAPDVRHWIEQQTFARDAGTGGLHLLDASCARFGDFDELTIVGLIEGEWPERPRRNIFYAPGMLTVLGWPSERDRRRAEAATFFDLVRSPVQQVAVSTFTLDDEARVEPSFLVDELAGVDLRRVRTPLVPARVFVDEALSQDPLDLEALDPAAREWAVMRAGRTEGRDVRYHGAAGRQPARSWSVSAVETYLTCPFKFFARYVLGLEEEREDEEVMDPKERGRFIHAVFESFFTAWQDRGHRAITPQNLDQARALFVEIVDKRVRTLPEAEAALERTRLLGSSVAAGLGEVVFRMEAERPTPVVERLLEHRLTGEFELTGADGPRRVALHGVADRIDLLEDGTMRLIDYKLSSAPTRSRALQLPIYGLCAEQHLHGHRGRSWTLGEAAYIAFRGARRVTPLFTPRADRDDVLGAAQETLIDAVDRIERGEFPPTPDDVFLCGFCSYATVCRKDYVGDV